MASTTLDVYIAIKMIRNEFARIPTYSEQPDEDRPSTTECQWYHDDIETEDGLFLVMELPVA